MKFFRDILTDLVEKRLWPVAAILVALVVAVPMTVAKPGDAPVAPPVPNGAVDSDTGPELALTRAVTTGFSRAPHVSTKELDPFADRTEAPTDSIVKSLNDTISSIANTGTTSTTTTTTSGGSDGVTPVAPSSGGSGGSGDTPTTPDTSVKTETDDVITVQVAQGDNDPTMLEDVRTLSPLPDDGNTTPFLIYVGKTSSDKASFLVSSTASVSGPGSCDPSPADCRTLILSVGDTEHFKVTQDDGSVLEYDFTLVDLETKKVPVSGDESAVKAARAEHRARKVGAKVLLAQLKDPTVVRSLVKHKIKFR